MTAAWVMKYFPFFLKSHNKSSSFYCVITTVFSARANHFAIKMNSYDPQSVPGAKFNQEPQGGSVKTWQQASRMADKEGARRRNSSSSYQCQSLAPLSGADWQWRRAFASWRTWPSPPSPAIHSGPASAFWWTGTTCLCSVVRGHQQNQSVTNTTKIHISWQRAKQAL